MIHLLAVVGTHEMAGQRFMHKPVFFRYHPSALLACLAFYMDADEYAHAQVPLSWQVPLVPGRNCPESNNKPGTGTWKTVRMHWTSEWR